MEQQSTVTEREVQRLHSSKRVTLHSSKKMPTRPLLLHTTLAAGILLLATRCDAQGHNMAGGQPPAARVAARRTPCRLTKCKREQSSARGRSSTGRDRPEPTRTHHRHTGRRRRGSTPGR